MRRGEADPLDAVDRVDRRAAGRRTPGRYWPAPRSRPYEFTFWPSSVISETPSAASVSTSCTMSPMRRLTSRPRTDGTMQNAHELSQPIWIVTHAEWSTSRRAGNADGYASCSSRISTIGPSSSRACEELGRRREVVRPEHDVDVRRSREHDVAVLLREAAADRDLQVGPFVLQRLEVTEMPVQLVVGVLTDAARVEDDDVGGREIVGRLHALGREQARDAFGVVLVHLAAERAHEEPAGHGVSVRAAPPA